MVFKDEEKMQYYCNKTSSISSTEDLEKGLSTIIQKIGLVLETGVLKSHGWFEGEGYGIAYFDKKNIDKIIHELSWPDEDVIYASWSTMHQNCSFFYRPGHSKLDCPLHLTRCCWSCHSATRLFRLCPHKSTKSRHTKDINFSKQPRYILSSSESFSVSTESTPNAFPDTGGNIKLLSSPSSLSLSPAPSLSLKTSKFAFDDIYFPLSLTTSLLTRIWFLI